MKRKIALQYKPKLTLIEEAVWKHFIPRQRSSKSSPWIHKADRGKECEAPQERQGLTFNSTALHMNTFSMDCKQVTHALWWRKHFSLKDVGQVLNLCSITKSHHWHPGRHRGVSETKKCFYFGIILIWGKNCFGISKFDLGRPWTFGNIKKSLLKVKKTFHQIKYFISPSLSRVYQLQTVLYEVRNRVGVAIPF